MPSTFAGMIQNSAVHQLVPPSVMVAVSSASQSSIVNEFDRRVPGFRSRSVGRSFRLSVGSRTG